MTTMPPTRSLDLPPGPAPSALARAFRSAETTVFGWVATGVLGIAFVVAFLQWFIRQFGPSGYSAVKFEDWGHAYVVPIISGAYIWTQRTRLAQIPACTYWPGLGVMALGIACYLFFILGYTNHMFQGFAIITTIAGAVLLLLGPHLFRMLLFPLCYLGFAVTVSEMVMNKVTWPLKIFASQGAHVVLRMFGTEVTRTGNILEVFVPATGKVHPLNVADACSGMRMVVAFIALSVAVAFFSCRQWWQRIAVLLLAIPVALLMNILRVAILAWLTLINPDLSVGESHTLIGTLLLVPAFLLFMLCVWILKKITPDEAATAGSAA